MSETYIDASHINASIRNAIAANFGCGTDSNRIGGKLWHLIVVPGRLATSDRVRDIERAVAAADQGNQ
jgi:phage baseplate assembly protein W